MKRYKIVNIVLNGILVGIFCIYILLLVVPAKSGLSKNVKVYAVGYDETYFVIAPNGDLIGWGGNDNRAVGTGNFFAYPYIARKTILRNVESLDIGNRCVMAVDKQGHLWGWGSKSQYHDIFMLDAPDAWMSFWNLPFKIMDDVKSVSLDSFYAAAIKTDGTLSVWGSNFHGESISRPRTIMEDVKFIFAGHEALFAIKTNGDLYCWYWLSQLNNADEPALLAENIEEVYHMGVENQYQVKDENGNVKIFDLGNGYPLINEIPVYTSNVKSLCNRGLIKDDDTFWSWEPVDIERTDVVLTKQMDNVASAANKTLIVDNNGKIYTKSAINGLSLPHSISTVSPTLRNILVLFLVGKCIYSIIYKRKRRG